MTVGWLKLCDGAERSLRCVCRLARRWQSTAGLVRCESDTSLGVCVGYARVGERGVHLVTGPATNVRTLLRPRYCHWCMRYAIGRADHE